MRKKPCPRMGLSGGPLKPLRPNAQIRPPAKANRLRRKRAMLYPAALPQFPGGIAPRAALAQLVEHIIRNDGVASSSHASGTILRCAAAKDGVLRSHAQRAKEDLRQKATSEFSHDRLTSSHVLRLHSPKLRPPGTVLPRPHFRSQTALDRAQHGKMSAHLEVRSMENQVLCCLRH